MSIINKLSLTPHDIAADRLEQLRGIFPEVFAEGKIDHDTLLRMLGKWVDPGKERFGLNWPGKAECMKVIQRPSVGTLLPMREESVNFDTSENLIIEGDNLEVLKLLQRSYYGKVKMIYIDPPYNTGNEFIYPDNFREGLDEYLRFSGQVDAEGYKLNTNTETEGRYHSKWLSMMYPRLFLARNLLRDDGVIFISIDDNEVHNLRALMNEVFGEENFIGVLVWQKSKKGDSKLIAKTHEYVVVYGRSIESLLSAGKWRRKKEGADEVLAHYQQLRKKLGNRHDAISAEMRVWYSSLSKTDSRRAHEHYRWSDERGLYFADNFAGPDDGRDSRPRYEIMHPITGKPCKKPSTGWRWDEKRTKEALTIIPQLIHFGPDGTTIPCRKSYLYQIDSEPLASVFYRDGRAGTLELEKLVGKNLLEFPKDVETLKDFIKIVMMPQPVDNLSDQKEDGTDSAYVLDFFAGSGTTSQSVLEINTEDCKNLKFILVQLPETTNNKEYPTISHITRERVRSVIKKLNEADSSKLGLDDTTIQDRGFKAFKLSSSNFKAWESDTTKVADVNETLSLFIDNIIPDRSQEDILYELLVKAGYPLSSPVERLSLAGKEAFSVACGNLLICLDKELTLAVVEAMVKLKPARILCLDEGFHGNDQLKVNVVQTVKSHNRKHESGIVFQVV